MKETITLTALAVAIVVMALGMQSAWAAPISVGNHSFEDASTGVLGSMNLVTSPLANWAQNIPDAGVGYSQEAGIPADGTCRGLLRTAEIAGTGTVWTQELATAFAADTVYALTVAVGGSGPNDVTHDGGAYDIALYAGDTELVAGSAIHYVTSTDVGTMLWKDATITYDPATSGATPTAGDPLKIVLSAIPDIAGQYWTAYDNVRLTAEPIPEPVTWALLLIGAACLAMGRRRNR